jgi:hypothetical protein
MMTTPPNRRHLTIQAVLTHRFETGRLPCVDGAGAEGAGDAIRGMKVRSGRIVKADTMPCPMAIVPCHWAPVPDTSTLG